MSVVIHFLKDIKDDLRNIENKLDELKKNLLDI